MRETSAQFEQRTLGQQDPNPSGVFGSASIETDAAAAGNDFENLHDLRQLDEELGIALKVMNPARIVPCEGRHSFDRRPIRDGDELCVVAAVLPEYLNAERLLF